LAISNESRQFFVRVEAASLGRLSQASSVRAVRRLFRANDNFVNAGKGSADTLDLGGLARPVDALDGN
jgi:hypothetical protein